MRHFDRAILYHPPLLTSYIHTTPTLVLHIVVVAMLVAPSAAIPTPQANTRPQPQNNNIKRQNTPFKNLEWGVAHLYLSLEYALQHKVNNRIR